MRDDCCNRYPHDSRCPYAPEPPTPRCPVCGKETDVFYICAIDVIGCDRCIHEADAYEWLDEERLNERGEVYA